MKVIGITGGIGSGKSRVLEYVKEAFGAYILQADEEGHKLMKPGEIVYRALVKRYGKEILQKDGTIDKQALSKIGFASKEASIELNELTHPLILKAIKAKIERLGESGLYPYLFYEAALPKEAKMSQLCDEIWFVSVSKSVRTERLMENRGYSREKCEMFIHAQMSDEEFEKMADFIIKNDSDFEQTKARIQEILS